MSAARRGPPGRSRAFERLARALHVAVTRAPWSWRLLRAPMTRFFDRVASSWDERFASNPQRMRPLEAALDRLPHPPARVLDVGTGTGAGALVVAARWPDAEVVGIDVARAMIAQARAKGADRAHVRFIVADVAQLERGPGFDLVTMLNVAPFFARVAGLLRPGGHVVCVASRGAATPFYTSEDRLRHGFERHGLVTVEAGAAGPGTYYLARRP